MFVSEKDYIKKGILNTENSEIAGTDSGKKSTQGRRGISLV